MTKQEESPGSEDSEKASELMLQNFCKYGWSGVERNQITYVFRDKDLDSSVDVDSILIALECPYKRLLESNSRYKRGKSAQKQLQPVSFSSKVKQFNQDVESLKKALESFDGDEAQIITERLLVFDDDANEITYQAFNELSGEILWRLNRLQDAITGIKTRRGRQPNPEFIKEFAADVVGVLEKHGIESSTTETGTFVSLLDYLLKVSGSDTKDAEHIASDAIWLHKERKNPARFSSGRKK